MHFIPAVLPGSAGHASTPHWPAFLSAVGPEVPGLLVLLAGLIYLWLTVRQLQRSVRTLEGRLPAPMQPPPAARVPSQPEAIDGGVLAAIAAAVAVVLKQPHSIIAIQPDANTQHAWSAEGRRELYHSHKLR